MELNYFISGSQEALLSKKDTWLDTSSLTLRSFTKTKSFTFTGISGNSDFSIFFSFEKKDSNAGCLLSNMQLGSLRGFSLNFNNNNELFLHSNFNSIPDCHTFSEIRLAKKNCIAVVKGGQQITIFNYDLDSRSIYKKESFPFSSNTNLSGGSFLLGYNTYVLNQIALEGVSGVFDQMVCFNTALGNLDCETIFSGFLPLQGTFVTEYNKKNYELKQIETKENSILSKANASNLIPFLDYFASSSIPITSGNYISTISGIANAALSKIFWSGYYSFNENLFCYATGAQIPIGGEYNSYSPAAFNGNLTFNDEAYYSMNLNSEKTSSHLFSFYTNNPSIEDFFTYNKIEAYKTITTPTLVDSVSSDTYKKTFYMDGILCDKNYCNLAYYPNLSYKSVGLELLFDKSNGLFSLDSNFEIGHNLYWGLSGKIENYQISSNHINLNDIEEDNSYPLIYDTTNVDSKLLHSSNSSATGNFQRGAAVVFFGDFTRREYRQRREQFYETSSYHIAHSKKDQITLVNESGIYDNSDRYWSFSMRPLDPPAPMP
jgi:hypothetical protein